MIVLCEHCFKPGEDVEVLSVVPASPCAVCGSYDARDKGGAPTHAYREDPRS